MKATSLQIPFDDTWELMQVTRKKDKGIRGDIYEICVCFNNTWYIGMGYSISKAIEELEKNIEKRVTFRARFNLDEHGRPKTENVTDAKLEDLF